MDKAVLEAKRKYHREYMRKRLENPEYAEKQRQYNKAYRKRNKDKESQRLERFYRKQAERENI